MRGMLLKIEERKFGDSSTVGKYRIRSEGWEILLDGKPSVEDMEQVISELDIPSPAWMVERMLEVDSLPEFLKVLKDLDESIKEVFYEPNETAFVISDGVLKIPLESESSGKLGTIVVEGDLSPQLVVQLLAISDAITSISEGLILTLRNQEMMESALEVLSEAMQKRSGERILERILELFERIKGELGIDERILRLALYVYDVGKIGVKDSILKKGEWEMSEDELKEFRKHPVYGYEILKTIKEIPGEILDAALYHHERMDGSGYPYSLRGSDIPEIAYVVGILDEYTRLRERGMEKDEILTRMRGKFPDHLLELMRRRGV